MFRQLGQVRKAGALAVIAGLGLAGAHSATATAATWTGETHGNRERTSRLVSGTVSWQGSFTFTTDKRGQVDGQAVIAYTPRIDVSGLNNAVGYIRSYVGASLGLLGPFGGAVSNVGLNQIIGASVGFDPAMAIRRVKLTGSLDGGRLTLRSVGKPAGVRYTTKLVLASGSKQIQSDRSSLPIALQDTGSVDGGRVAIATSQDESRNDGVKQQVSSYWMATRVR